MDILHGCLGDLPGPCQGPYGTRRVFSVKGATLYVPDAIQDKRLRWAINQGATMEQAYAPGQYGSNLMPLMPPQGMKACCYDVLRTKWVDPQTGEIKLSGWGHTCTGFFQCFNNYVEALREYGKLGRIRIAHDLVCPSPNEITCIKLGFRRTRNIEEAYRQCAASDIFPTFPRAAMQISQFLDSEAAGKKEVYIEVPGILPFTTDRIKIVTQVTFYEMLQTLYFLSERTTAPAHHGAHLPPPPPEKVDWIVPAAVGLVLVVAMSRR